MAESVNNRVALIPIREIPINFQCPVLTSTNYNSWSIKIESIMDAQGLWDAIEPPAGVEIDAKIVKKARAFILQSLPEDILLQVAEYREASELWKALKTRYLGATRVQKARIQTLTREFELLSMRESDSIDDLAGKITEISSKIQALGSSISSDKQVKKLLNSAPDRFLPIVASIEQYSDLETMPFEEAIGRLKAYEERVKPKEATAIKNQAGQLLLTKAEWEDRSKSDRTQTGRGKGFARTRGRGRGKQEGGRNRWSQQSSNKRSDKEDKTKNHEGKRDRKMLRCYNCDKIGHFSSECRAPRKTDDELNLAHDVDEPTLLIAMCSQDMVMLNEESVNPSLYGKNAREKGEELWYLDNGASNHMTGDKTLFSDLDESKVGNVRFGDGSLVEIRGIGSVVVQCKNEDQKVFTKVYYIPDLCHNILSLG